MSLLHAVAFLFCLQCMTGAAGGQNIKTSVRNEELTLPCESINSNRMDAYLWNDVLPQPAEPRRVFTVTNGAVTKSDDEKYINFNADNSSYPMSVPMIIESIVPEDEGTYRCTTAVTAISMTYDVHVEVPAAVEIKYESVNVESLTVTVGESYAVTCEATGSRSRNELTLNWEPHLEGGTVSKLPNGDFTDYNLTSTYTPKKEDRSITCQLTGYVLQDEIKDLVFDSIGLTVQYKPECSLTVVNTVDGDCKMVTLTCECTAVPETTEYFFYNGSTEIYNAVTNTIDVTVGYEVTSEFSCQASNNIGTGDQSNQENHLCEEATVTTSTTPAKEGNPTDSPGPSVALIASLSACVGILIVICVIGVMWFLKSRGGINKVCAN